MNPQPSFPATAAGTAAAGTAAEGPALTDSPADATPVSVAVVGCGNIAGRYAENLAQAPGVRLTGAYDLIPERAREFAEANSIRAYSSLVELLADPAVGIVVNLTRQDAHFTVTQACLSAGKHVYSEKPLALDYRDAVLLVKQAEESGLRLGCSPSVWLAPAQQTAWREVAAGRLGMVRAVYAEVNWGRIERWHPDPAGFYAVGPLFDVGVYPIAYLTAVFGAVRKVTAAAHVLMPDRVTTAGRSFTASAPDFVVAILQTEQGQVIRLTCNFYVSNDLSQQGIEFHGDLGSLHLTNWVTPNAEVRAADFGHAYERLPLIGSPASAAESGGEDVNWARGVIDMAQALSAGREHRASGAHGAHVVEVLNAVITAASEHREVAVHSQFPQPAPVNWSLAAAHEASYHQ